MTPSENRIHETLITVDRQQHSSRGKREMEVKMRLEIIFDT